MNSIKFNPGNICSTPGVLAEINMRDITDALNRHLLGDWGSLSEEDREANEDALLNEGRLLSSYVSSNEIEFWIITEADRSVTTLLLPSEY